MVSLEIQVADLRAEVAGLAASVASLRAAAERQRVPAVLPDRGLTRREAAEALGLTVFALHRWATRGEGPPFRVFAGKAYYRAADLHAWAERRASTSRRSRGPADPAEPAELPLLGGGATIRR